MAARKTKQRALLALNEETLIWPGFLRGVRNYTLLHPNVVTHVQLFLGDPVSDRRMFQSMLHRFRPDGVLARVYWPVADQLLPAGIPLVNVDDETKSGTTTVMTDQVLAGRMAAEHLLEQKLPHFAYIAPPASYAADLRRQGFAGRLQEAGYSCAVFDMSLHPKKAIDDETLLNWVEKLPKPVGIHTYTLALAARLLWACQEGKLHVPSDVALIGGQDNSALATAMEPSISAIIFDDVRIGYEGMRFLHQLMCGAPLPEKPLLLPPLRLMPRASSDMLSVQDAEISRIRKWIRENAHCPLTVKDLLAQTKLSRRTLERRFQSLAGHTIHNEIEAVRMERVQAMLRETTLPLSRVAEQCGFANYVTFSTAFRRITGKTASAFRKRTALSINL